MPATSENVRRVVAAVLDELEVELFDLDRTSGRLIVTIDRRPDGVDIDTIAAVTRALSRALDEADAIDAHYVLEVTSPGLERKLRNAAQYRWAIGKQVSVRVRSPEATEATERRCTGTLVAADDEGIDVQVDEPAGEVVHLAYSSIQTGRTVVDWDAELKGRSSSDPETPSESPKPNRRPAPKSGPSRRDRTNGANDQRVSNR